MSPEIENIQLGVIDFNVGEWHFGVLFRNLAAVSETTAKRLHLGDCHDLLKELHNKYPNGFIDLVYIDPPSNPTTTIDMSC